MQIKYTRKNFNVYASVYKFLYIHEKITPTFMYYVSYFFIHFENIRLLSFFLHMDWYKIYSCSKEMSLIYTLDYCQWRIIAFLRRGWIDIQMFDVKKRSIQKWHFYYFHYYVNRWKPIHCVLGIICINKTLYKEISLGKDYINHDTDQRSTNF